MSTMNSHPGEPVYKMAHDGSGDEGGGMKAPMANDMKSSKGGGEGYSEAYTGKKE